MHTRNFQTPKQIRKIINKQPEIVMKGKEPSIGEELSAAFTRTPAKDDKGYYSYDGDGNILTEAGAFISFENADFTR